MYQFSVLWDHFIFFSNLAQFWVETIVPKLSHRGDDDPDYKPAKSRKKGFYYPEAFGLGVKRDLQVLKGKSCLINSESEVARVQNPTSLDMSSSL